MTQKKLTMSDLQSAIYQQNNVIVAMQSQIVTLQKQINDILQGMTLAPVSETPAPVPAKSGKLRVKTLPQTAPKSTSPDRPKFKGHTAPKSTAPAPAKNDPYQTLLNDAIEDIKQGIKSARFNEKIIPQCDYDLRVFCTRGMNKRIKTFRVNHGIRLAQVSEDLVTLYGADKAQAIWE